MYDEFLKFKKALEKEIDDFRIRKSNLQDWVERTVSANARTLQNEDVYTLQHNVRDINNELIRMQDGVDRRFVDFQEKLEEISDWTLSIRAFAASFNQRSPDLSPVNAYQHLVTYLNSIAEGCNEAKEEIAFCIVNHLQRRAYPFFNSETKDLPLLVVGEPGTGKTYLVKEAVKKANFPLFYIDLEQIVAQGNFFIGLKNEIATLEKKHANEFAVVFLDNIDVISSIQTNGFPGLKAQKEVFSFLKKIIDSKNDQNFIFFAAGSFPDIKRNETPTFSKKRLVDEGGMIPELMSCFNSVQTELPSEKSFVDWLQKKDYPFQVKKTKLERVRVFVSWKDPSNDYWTGLARRLTSTIAWKNHDFKNAKKAIDTALERLYKERRQGRNFFNVFKEEIDAGILSIQKEGDNIFVKINTIDFFVKEELPEEEIETTTEKVRAKNLLSFVKKMTEEDVFAHLNSVAIGNEEAKQDIAAHMMLHLERVRKILEIRSIGGNEDECVSSVKSLFVVGESGCGKNLLIEAAAKKLGLPFVAIDASGITAEGYEGTKIERELAFLDEEPLKEFVIIFLNELDKLSTKAGGPEKGVGGMTAQNQSLTFLEGFKRINGMSTKNILIVGAGAFEHIERNGRKILTREEVLKEGGMSEQFGERFSFIQIESADFESFSKWLRDPKQPFQLSIKSLKDDRSVDFIMDEGLLDQLALRLSKKTSHFRSAKECITRAFFKIIRSRILKRNIVEDFKDVDGVEVIQTPDNRIRVTVKSIDFFVKEEKAKTSEEVVLDAMKGRAYREKVEEEAKGLQARKEAEDLVRRLEPVESQLRRRTEEAEIELQARKNAELNVGWWGPRLWGGAGTLILYLSQEALRKLMK
jgi:ATP-dependent protease Clp ATPase subunit